MMDESWYRIVNTIVAFSIAGTLSWRHFYFRSRNGFDNRFRSASSIALFAWIAVASGVALSRDLPMPFTVKVSAVLLVTYLVALWTPWRWNRLR